jgi:hypothetical protein
MKEVPLELIQGDTKVWKIQIRQNNVSVDISGWLIFFTAKTDYAVLDTDAAIAITMTVPSNVDSQNGIAYLELSSDDTNIDIGEYYYDIKYQSTERITIVRGHLTIVPTITQRIS